MNLNRTWTERVILSLKRGYSVYLFFITMTTCISLTPLSGAFCVPDKYSDSLTRELMTAREDTSKIAILLEITTYLKDGKPDSALLYLQKAEKEIEHSFNRIQQQKGWLNRLIKGRWNREKERNLTRFHAKMLRVKGNICLQKNKYSEASDLLNQSLLESSEINDIRECNLSLLDIGLLYYNQGNYSKAIENYQFVLNISRKSGYKDCIYSAYGSIGYIELKRKNYDSSVVYYTRALGIANELDDKSLQATTLNSIGNVYFNNGNYSKAVDCYRQAIAISREGNDAHAETISLSNIGNIYSRQGRFAEAIEVYLRALNLLEKGNDMQALSDCYSKLGEVYTEKENYNQALTYFLKSLEIFEKNNQTGNTTAYLNLGFIYTKLNKTPEALKSYQKSIEYQKKKGDNRGIVKSYIGLAELYRKIGDFQLSKFYLEKSLGAIDEFKDPSINAKIHLNYSQLYLITGEINKAQEHGNLALINAYKTDDTPLLMNTIELIAEVYEKNGKYKEAYLHQLQGYRLLDSISRKSKNELITSVEAYYIAEQRQHELEVLNKEKELQKLKIKEKEAIVMKQQILQYFYLAGFITVLILGFLLFRQAQHKKAVNIILKQQNQDIQQKNEEIIAQRDEIEAQRDEIEAQRNDITRQKEELEKLFQLQTDSILYARQIQNAILPESYVFKDNLPDSFVFYRPKDIVSGDFYWISPIGEKIGLAVADCTGHGVAGAMLSMLGSSLLNELTVKTEELDPGELLTDLRSYMVLSLWQRGLAGEQIVGMDLAFCLLDPKTLLLKYAGANNSIFICTKDDNHKDSQLIELLPDNMPISMSIRMNSFTTKTHQLKKGDSLYLFTDGFSDQFGGPNSKKYTNRRFKDFVLSVVQLPMSEQEKIFSEEFEKWKDKNLQTDDVTVLGARV